MSHAAYLSHVGHHHHFYLNHLFINLLRMYFAHIISVDSRVCLHHVAHLDDIHSVRHFLGVLAPDRISVYKPSVSIISRKSYPRLPFPSYTSTSYVDITVFDFSISMFILVCTKIATLLSITIMSNFCFP